MNSEKGKEARVLKRIGAALVLLALLLSAAGCGGIIKKDYLSVQPHVEPSSAAPAQEPEEQPPLVGNRNELRGTVLSFVRDWTELGTIRVRDYDGDIAADLSETMEYITREDPIGAYAVDYADAELLGSASYGTIEVRLVFRRSAAEIDAIVTVSGSAGAEEKIRAALNNFDTALTLRIRNYAETDFAAQIRKYCLSNPAQMPVLPEVSASVYPQEGETRILELHFTYSATRDEMRAMQNSVSTLLSSASAYVRAEEDGMERMQRLFRYLIMRISYTAAEEPVDCPAYSLLKERLASSLSFASVVCAECSQSETPCEIVEGTRDGQSWAWNRIRLGGETYYVDLMRSWELQEADLSLLSREDLLNLGYAWEKAS